MIVVIIMIILALYQVEIFFSARWDAELLNEGQSNHDYKQIRITAFLLLCLMFVILSRYIYFEWFWWLKIGLIMLIYPFNRKMYFDQVINFYRKKPDNYKTSPLWVKWVSGFVMLGIIYLYIII